MKPRRIEYDVGKSKHKQSFVLVCTPGDGGPTYELRREAMDQRDDMQRIDGLTDDVIRSMAQAAKLIP